MDAYAASPRSYASAPASQLSPSCPYRAVLPVFALLTRAAAHVGLMCSSVPALQRQSGPHPRWSREHRRPWPRRASSKFESRELELFSQASISLEKVSVGLKHLAARSASHAFPGVCVARRSRALPRTVLAESFTGIDKSDVHIVALVGGSTRLPENFSLSDGIVLPLSLAKASFEELNMDYFEIPRYSVCMLLLLLVVQRHSQTVLFSLFLDGRRASKSSPYSQCRFARPRAALVCKARRPADFDIRPFDRQIFELRSPFSQLAACTFSKVVRVLTAPSVLPGLGFRYAEVLFLP